MRTRRHTTSTSKRRVDQFRSAFERRRFVQPSFQANDLLVTVKGTGYFNGTLPVLALPQPFRLGYVNDRGFAPKSSSATSKLASLAMKAASSFSILDLCWRVLPIAWRHLPTPSWLEHLATWLQNSVWAETSQELSTGTRLVSCFTKH
jgi:hypothetical protein